MRKFLITAVLIMALSTVGVFAKPYNYSSSEDEIEISFKFGYFMPNGDSELWDYNKAMYDYSEEDLNSFVGTIGFNYHLNNFMTLFLDMGVSFGWTTTEYSDYVDEYNQPIETDIQLTIMPIEIGLRINPIGRTHGVGQFNAKTKNAIIPYIGGGVGLYIYDYIEFGDYIDFYYEQIVYAEFESTDVAVGFFVVGGIEIPLGPDMSLLAEYKRSWVKSGLSDSFEGFDDFDLGGQTFSLGITMGF